MERDVGECPRCGRTDVLMMPDGIRLTCHNRPDGISCSLESIDKDGVMRFGDGHPKAVTTKKLHSGGVK